jgi:hypothetical protein
MTDPRLLQLINAEIDGELDGEQRAELSRRLLADPAARAERDELKRVCAALDGLPLAEPPRDLAGGVLAALPNTPTPAPALAWDARHRWRYLAVAACVLAALTVVFEMGRGPGTATTDAAATMADGAPALDSAQVAGAVTGRVVLYRDPAGLGLSLDLAASGPIEVLVESDGRTLRVAPLDGSTAGGIRRSAVLPGMTAHGQAVELTYLAAGQPVGGTSLRAADER